MLLSWSSCPPFSESIIIKPPLLQCTLSSLLVLTYGSPTPTHTLTHKYTNTQCRTQPWQSCSHSVCLIFSLAPLPSWEHSWHPEAQRGSDSALKAVSHFRAGTSSRYHPSFTPFWPPKMPRLPSVPERRILPWRMTSLKDGLVLFRGDSPRAKFPSAASTSGALPELPSKNVNWQRT